MDQYSPPAHPFRLPRNEPARIAQHPLLLARRAWVPGTLLLVAAVGITLLAMSGPQLGPPFSGLLLAAFAACFLAGGLWLGWSYLRWSATVLLLTERRLIELTGVPGIRREWRELPLDRVQSIEVRQVGVLARWCRCGDLIVDVAGGPPLRFQQAREVFAARDFLVRRLADEARQRETHTAEEVRDAVRGLLTPVAPTPALPASEAPGASVRPRQATRRVRLRFGRRFDGVYWRRHPWWLARRAVQPLAVLLLALAAPFLLDRLSAPLLAPYATPVTAGLLLLGGGWLAWLWADWRNDHYVLTHDRLIEVEQLPLGLRQQVSEMALDRVQDIRYRVPTPLAHLLNYGDVTVDTAGAAVPFIFRDVARPRELAAAIDERLTALRLAREAARYQELRDEFRRWLDAYREVLAETGG